jgi:hypothetical protein
MPVPGGKQIIGGYLGAGLTFGAGDVSNPSELSKMSSAGGAAAAIGGAGMTAYSKPGAEGAAVEFGMLGVGIGARSEITTAEECLP